jgi:phosphate starvation-inducible PhoH-like protein
VGPNILRQLVDGSVIKVIPLAFFRGLTLDNKIVLYDEAQNSTSTAMKSFLTRIGDNTKMIVMGDINQADRKGISGLADAISRLETLDETGHLEFTDDDIVRHTIIGKILAKYEHDPNEK